MLLDRDFRLRFYAAPQPPSPATLASIALHELDEARVFHAHVLAAGIDTPSLETHARIMADAVMRELRALSPALCALPAARHERRRTVRARLSA
jgi:hypothetical protein